MGSNVPIPSQPPSEFYKAVGQFNAKAFWECHETLEPLWLSATEPLKTFLQGVIQTAAGFHHLSRGNYKGTINLLNAGLEKLSSVKTVSTFQRWMDLTRFIHSVERAKAGVEELGPSRIEAFPPEGYPQITLHPL